MDFPGLKWAGNIYQKFEAMCLEVEDAIYQDAIKYMETQGQKVGIGLKKLYSEHVEDLLPASCVDPMKIAPLGLKRMTENLIPPKMYSPMSSLQEGINTFSEMIGPTVASAEMNGVSSLDFVVRSDPEEAVTGNTHMCDTPIEYPVPGEISSAESMRLKNEDISPASDNNLSAVAVRVENGDSSDTPSCCGMLEESIGKSMNDISISNLGSSIRSNFCNVTSYDEEIMASIKGTSMKDGSSSYSISEVMVSADSGDKKGIITSEDILDIEIIENEEVDLQGLEFIEPVERLELAETCALVEGDEADCLPHGSVKQKSYKKKIREALSLKLRSTRKQDQYVARHKDLGRKNTENAAISDAATDSVEEGRAVAQDSFESDWEII